MAMIYNSKLYRFYYLKYVFHQINFSKSSKVYLFKKYMTIDCKIKKQKNPTINDHLTQID